jgi:hypothetical protein
MLLGRGEIRLLAYKAHKTVKKVESLPFKALIDAVGYEAPPFVADVRIGWEQLTTRFSLRCASSTVHQGTGRLLNVGCCL